MQKEQEYGSKKNRRAQANPLSAATFCWTLPIFWEGYKRDLLVEDLPVPLEEHKSTDLGNKLESAWNAELKKTEGKNKSPSFFKALFDVFGWKLLFYGIFMASTELGARVVQPLLLGRLIRYFTPGSQITSQEGYMYAFGLVSSTGFVILVSHPFLMAMLHIGMKVRVAVCSLLYRKGLKLNKISLNKTPVGKLINLMSNDVSRFEFVFLFLHILWIGPTQTLMVAYFLWNEVEWAALIGMACLLSFIPFQAFLGRKLSTYRLKTANRTDERVRLMNEIISGIQVIKMYTWEKPFANLVAQARKKEIKYITESSYIKGSFITFVLFHARASIFCSVIAYVLSGKQITAEKVFVLTSFYNTLQTMTFFFPLAVSHLSEMIVSVKRIKEFLLLDEFSIEKLESSEGKGDLKSGIEVKNVSASWAAEGETLVDVSFEATPGDVTVIIGQVGSGKSSLLNAILKELELTSGSINVKGSISYASQDAWLFHGSVRQNILFGEDYSAEKYKKVVKVCALEADLQMLPYGDKTIVGERGVTLSGGQRARINLARAVYKDADIYLLDDPLSAVDPHVSKHLFDDCIQGYLKKKVVILVTHQFQYLEGINQIVLLENGRVLSCGSYDELVKSGQDFSQFLNVEEKTDESNEGKTSRRTSINSVNSLNDSKIPPPEIAESQVKGSVDLKIYFAYLKAGGGWFSMVFMLFMFFFAQVLASGVDYWTAYWVNLEEHTFLSESKRNFFIYVFSGLLLGTIVFSLIRTHLFFFLCMKSSMNLHNQMFESLTRSKMWFFNNHSSGRILNRFSKDMGAIDEQLTITLLDVLQIFIGFIGVITLVSIVNPWLLIPTAICVVLSFIFRVFYIATSRSIKRLEGITKSPIFAHTNASLQGITTIRAFGAQETLIKEFDALQDHHSSAYYLFIALSRSFGYWLDMICLAYIFALTLSFFVMEENSYGGDVGLVISQAIGVTLDFQWAMRQTAELENQMTSVERVLEYTKIEPEPQLESTENQNLKKSWPEKGKIEFKDLCLRYSQTDPWVLSNLSFVIQPNEKVGIVGRTGAGKSSLISALFRLSELKGQIVIDDIDTGTIGLHDLRSKISIIPQEPVLFSGTFRKNLDPFDEYNDDILWTAIEEVELKEVVQDLAGGLQGQIFEGGSNLSVGQRQLVCLARAIIKNNKILVLDEATANVDPHTDVLIQKTIRERFKHCTVLTIAHRLHTVMDSDKVLVMDAGNMVEFDHPYDLLKNKEGFFYKMVEKLGQHMANKLTSIAHENYISSQNG